MTSRCASATSVPTSPSATGSCLRSELDRVEVVLPRRSAFVRRASFEGSRAESQTIAANIDVVMLVHALDVAAQSAPTGARAGAGVGQRRPARSSC